MIALRKFFPCSPRQLDVHVQHGSSSSSLLQLKGFFVHLRHFMMAGANMTYGSQAQSPELSAMRTQQENLLSKSLEMRGLLVALCKV